MMTNDNMNRWCVVHAAFKSERKLMQRLNAAGYTAFCPMQIVYKKWNGRTREVFMPLFSGCLFVEDTVDVVPFIASQNASFLVDSEGKKISICAEKSELSAKFVQLLK